MKKIYVVRKEKQLSNRRRFQSLQIWSLGHEGYSNKKLQKKSICEEITSGIQLQTFPQKKWYEKTPISNLKNSLQKLNPTTEATILFNRKKNKREAVAVFFHFCLNKIWAAGQTHVCNSKSSIFFYSSQARNTFQVPAAPPLSKRVNRLH